MKEEHDMKTFIEISRQSKSTAQMGRKGLNQITETRTPTFEWQTVGEIK
jgi:hypothetical protein